MGIRTNIAWCDSTINLAVGCSGCELLGGHCYAEALVGRFAGKTGWPKKFSAPQIYPGRLASALAWPDLTGQKRRAKPWLDGMPRVIFVNDLAETFDPKLRPTWFDARVCQMQFSRHIWIVLTKQPGRMKDFVEWWQMQHCENWPENVWLGVSLTDQQTADERLDVAAQIGLPIIVSAEPLLGAIDFGHVPEGAESIIRWMITGGESGPNARPCHIDWLDWIREQCQESHIPVFIKQWGANPHKHWRQGECGTQFDGVTPCPTESGMAGVCLKDPKGGDWDEWPAEIRVRQVLLEAIAEVDRPSAKTPVAEANLALSPVSPVSADIGRSADRVPQRRKRR